MLDDDTVVGQLARGEWAEADVAEADRAMLRYAVRLTEHPHGVGAADVGALRAEGFGDAAILDICQVTAYYNYVNRLADGLGVELEDGWDEADLVLGREEFEGSAGG